MATVPSPRTWAPAEIPTATHFNADIRDPVNFYKRPPATIVKATTTVSIASETWTVVSWNDTDVVDTDAIHDPAVNNSRLIAVTAGWYHFFAHVRWGAVADNIGLRGLQVRKNSGGAVAGGTRMGFDMRHSNNFTLDNSGCGLTGFAQLTAGQYLDCWVYHDHTNGIATPTALNLNLNDTTSSPRFGMVWIAS